MGGNGMAPQLGGDIRETLHSNPYWNGTSTTKPSVPVQVPVFGLLPAK